MYRISLLLASVFLLGACQPAQEKQNTPLVAEAATQVAEWKNFGKQITAGGALDANQLPELLGSKDSITVKLQASALSSCPKKGCWMKVGIGGKKQMRVTFKDYGFFVPKDLAGEEVIVEGVLKKKVTDMETLRHFAMDEGASAEEIAQITEPKEEFTFEAVGVLIKQ